ncbi:hypothetical protein ACHAW6_005776 [Cyclotella cf. meneghiniana]
MSAIASNAKDKETLSFDHVPWPVRPSLGINYDFIVSMYLGGCCLAILFFILEKRILAPLIDTRGSAENNDGAENNIGDDVNSEKDIDPWKEFAKGMQGMYFVFAPFLLCLPWSLIVRYYWRKETKRTESKEEKED